MMNWRVGAKRLGSLSLAATTWWSTALLASPPILSAALAAMPPSGYEDALAAADTHVQIEVTARDLLPRADGHGICRVSGKVVGVFGGISRPGDEISAMVPCRHEGADVPMGGTIFLPVERLAAARFLELVLVGRADGDFDVAGQGMGASIISEASSEPFFKAVALKSDGPRNGHVQVER